jgi:hypothetical protein
MCLDAIPKSQNYLSFDFAPCWAMVPGKYASSG